MGKGSAYTEATEATGFKALGVQDGETKRIDAGLLGGGGGGSSEVSYLLDPTIEPLNAGSGFGITYFTDGATGTNGRWNALEDIVAPVASPPTWVKLEDDSIWIYATPPPSYVDSWVSYLDLSGTAGFALPAEPSDPQYTFGSNEETSLVCTGNNNSYVQVPSTRLVEANSYRIQSDGNPAVFCFGSLSSVISTLMTACLGNYHVLQRKAILHLKTFSQDPSFGFVSAFDAFTITAKEQGADSEGWGNNPDVSSGVAKRYTLSATQFNELDSQIGHLTIYSTIQAENISGLTPLSNPYMNQTCIQTVYHRDEASAFNLLDDFSAGARVRFVDGADNRMLMILPVGHNLSLSNGYTYPSVADYDSYGICFNTTTNRFYVKTDNNDSSGATFGDTVEFQYAGNSIWRVQFFDFASYVDGAIPWSKVDKTGATEFELAGAVATHEAITPAAGVTGGHVNCPEVPTTTQFLRDDGTWETPAGGSAGAIDGGSANTNYTIEQNIDAGGA